MDHAAVLTPSLTGNQSRFVRTALNWLGGLLGLAGLVFVGYRVGQQFDQISEVTFAGRAWVMFILASIIYGFANFLLALAWYGILGAARAGVAWPRICRIYGTSQLAKYVPGNVFQFAGRQALGMAAGLPGGVLAKSAIIEIVLLALSGSVFAGLALPLFGVPISVFVALLLFLLLIIGVGATLSSWKGQRMMGAFFLQVLFFVISGLVFLIVLNAVNSGTLTLSDTTIVVGAYVLAWLAGFLTPGAPAGVGIREFALSMMLGFLIPESDLLLAVIIARVVTMAGDVAFYGMAAINPWYRAN